MRGLESAYVVSLALMRDAGTYGGATTETVTIGGTTGTGTGTAVGRLSLFATSFQPSHPKVLRSPHIRKCQFVAGF